MEEISNKIQALIFRDLTPFNNRNSDISDEEYESTKLQKDFYFIREPNGQETEFFDNSSEWTKSPEKRLGSFFHFQECKHNI